MTRSLFQLLAGSAALAVGLASSAAAQDQAAPAQFEAPVLVQAGGEVIDMSSQIGYAGPALYDANGDGLLDLYVGCFRGKILFAPNTGSRAEPVFGKPRYLQAEGKEIEISNW